MHACTQAALHRHTSLAQLFPNPSSGPQQGHPSLRSVCFAELLSSLRLFCCAWFCSTALLPASALD